jgi:BlaI family transcriptional regulator, penicillinase repressor
MKKKIVPELGPLEFKLLRILWNHQALTAPQVLDEYNRKAETPLAYTTVMTLLGRLAEKDVLTVNRERQPYRFSAAISREQMLRQRVRDFVNIFFEGQSLDLVMRLVEDTPLSEESVQKLEEVLRARKSKSKAKRGS